MDESKAIGRGSSASPTEDILVNRVANSALLTFDLEDLYVGGERVALDIADRLYERLILREKEFREFIRQHDWQQYQGKLVAVYCSADAIVPTWAYMLVGIALQPFAQRVVFGALSTLEEQVFRDQLATVDWTRYQDAKVVVKGCSKVEVPVAIYVEATVQLRKYAASIMYGEPCSTVPLFKRPK